jgi:hypothetical protein
MFFLAPGKNTQKKPRRTIEIVSFAVIFGLAVDGILIKADFYDLSNTARFLFGGLAGIAFYNLIMPYLLYFTGSHMATAYFRPIVYGLIFSLFILFYVGVYHWLPHVSIAGLLAFFLSVNLMFSAAISGGRKAFRKKPISPVFIRNVILLISLESILLAFLNNL